MQLSSKVRIGQLAWIAPLIAAALVVGGCAPAPAVAAKKESSSTVEKLGDGLNKLSVTQRASERLGMESARVQTATIAGESRLTIPYGAVIYDKDGGIWAYTAIEPRVFVRHKLTVAAIEGPVVILSAGPPAGTEVVTVGAAELYGLEFGIGK